VSAALEFCNVDILFAQSKAGQKNLAAATAALHAGASVSHR